MQDQNKPQELSDMQEQKIVNGVNVTQLFDTMDAIRETPAISEFVFRSENRWIDGGHNRSNIKGFYGACQEDTTRTVPFVLDNDEAAILLGTDKGANPVEYVLHALCGCLTTSLIYHAAARGIRVDAVESRCEGDLDLQGFLGMSDTIRNGYRQIRVVFNVQADAPREVVEGLVQVAQERSPVFDIVSKSVPVSVRLAGIMDKEPSLAAV